jgi:hypothetical protein
MAVVVQAVIVRMRVRVVLVVLVVVSIGVGGMTRVCPTVCLERAAGSRRICVRSIQHPIPMTRIPVPTARYASTR